jgi:DNA-binding response OmpR family regulator
MSERKRVLIIDDEEICRISAERILKRHGYQVDMATSGEQGIQLFRERGHDAVLLDVKMPRMDGIEVARIIKGLSPDTRIIMVSGYDTERMRYDVSELGASHFLEKPFTPGSLLEAIKNL